MSKPKPADRIVIMAKREAPQLKLLVVDDDHQVLDVFKALVGPLGYDVVGLSDSREAVQRVMKEKFDMIAVDVRMPGLDGFELTQRIRASPSNRNVPILMITAYDEIETLRRGYAAGITFYLAKPLNVPQLRGLFAAARGMMVQERRRYARLPVRLDVVCRVGDRQFKGSFEFRQVFTALLRAFHILLELVGPAERSHKPKSA